MTSPVCPECGYPPDATAPPPRALWRWRTWLPIFISLAVAAAIVTWAMRSATTVMTASGTVNGRLVTPFISMEDVRAMARGDLIAAPLIEAMRQEVERYPNSYGLMPDFCVGVSAEEVPKDCAEVWSVGWPTPWVARTAHARYADARDRSTLIPIVTGGSLPGPFNPAQLYGPDSANAVGARPPWTFRFGNAYYAPAPETTGGRLVLWRIELISVLAALGVFIALAVALRAMVWWLDRRRVRRGKAPMRRLRRAVIALALVCLGAVALTFESSENWYGQRQVITALRGSKPPEMHRLAPDAFAAAIATPEGMRELIGRIGALDHPDDYVVRVAGLTDWGWKSEPTVRYGGQLDILCTYDRRTGPMKALGFAMPFEQRGLSIPADAKPKYRPWSLTVERGRLSLSMANELDPQRRMDYALDIRLVGLALLAVVGSGALVWFIDNVPRRRRVALSIREGRCLACGYQVRAN